VTPVRHAAVLVLLLFLQACATAPDGSPPAPSQQEGSAPSPVEPRQAEPAPRVVGPGIMDSTQLPPFDGDKREIKDPLRGLAKIDRTAPVDDLWQRIRQGFSMPDLNDPLVQEKTNQYIARPDYLQRIFDRSRIYLYHIVEEIEKRGLPTELALLPMVESAFNPMAYSRAHASGLWQFIPGTGRRFELQQNWWYDGRRDIVESTKAALDYLTTIYEMHGDWHLALASYNWGEGAVGRAIAKNRAAGKPTDYLSLTMPAETRHYIPKLQALKNIVANPAPFGVVLDPIPNTPYFASYTKLRDIDVRLAAKLAEMPVEQFIALNPGFSRPIIRASVTPRIILPADRVQIFHDNLAKHDDKALVSWQTYQPKKGDTFESIAKKYSMTVGQLKEVNGIGPRVRVPPATMVVPVNGAVAANLGKLPIMYAPPIPVRTRKIFHTVRAGDSLPSIAKRYAVSVEDLKRWNRIGRLTPGQKIAVEIRAPVRGKAKPKAKGKVVRKAGR
jgi:membrane-bound lytic murein transglycosylase D